MGVCCTILTFLLLLKCWNFSKEKVGGKKNQSFKSERPEFKKSKAGTSLVVQWLRLHAPNAGGPGSIPSQGTRSHMPQLKILLAATKKRPHRPQQRSRMRQQTRVPQLRARAAK